VPTLIALLASSVVAWLLDDVIRDFTGMGVSMLLGAIVGSAAFFFVKRYVSDLRGG